MKESTRILIDSCKIFIVFQLRFAKKQSNLIFIGLQKNEFGYQKKYEFAQELLFDFQEISLKKKKEIQLISNGL